MNGTTWPKRLDSWTLAIACIAIALVCSGEEITLTTRAGRKIENATLSRVEPDGIVLMTDSGIEKVHFDELAPELQKKFGYDPRAAAAFTSAVRNAAARGDQSAAAAVAAAAEKKKAEVDDSQKALATRTAAREAAAKEAAKGMTNQPILFLQGKVIQVTAKGILIDGRLGQGKRGAKETTLLFVKDATSVVGEKVELAVVSDGMFAYTSTGGSEEQVPSFRLK